MPMPDPFSEEIKANSQEIDTIKSGLEESSEGDNNRKEHEEGKEYDQQNPIEEFNAMTLFEDRGTQDELLETYNTHMQAKQMEKAVGWAIEEAVPLNLQSLEEEKDPEFDATI